MPENVNTTPLEMQASDEEVAVDERAPMVEIDHVSMIFNMANQQLNSLKEYAIALAKRELMFKEFRALDDVSFTVRKGDVFGILGTNGSGKSTMLKIIAGVLEPSKGTCSIHGNIAPLIELGAGFDMELTARENIYLNGALLGYSRKFIDQHFDEIVEFAEIAKFLDMPMKNYSSGMVARIAFAIATIIVPEILIVDEVLSVGDFMFQQKCERRITKLIKEYGVTVLIVSHNNDQIERLCNKAIWIEKGHTRMIGDASEVCRTYRVLGGHIGSAEAEQRVFGMLNKKVRVPASMIDTISGETRYGTAAKLVEECEFEQGGVAIVAPGEQASPCLATAGLSGILDAAVLLAKPDTLGDVTAQELKQLKPSRVLVVGSEEVIPANTLEAVQEVCPDAAVERIGGTTPTQIANSMYRLGVEAGAAGTTVAAGDADAAGAGAKAAPSGWGRTAIITYDGCTGDLISFSPYLFQKHVPVFFVPEFGTVDEETAETIHSGAFDTLLVLGGDVHVPEAFLDECRERGMRCDRVCGDGPYNANELINGIIASHSDFDGIDIERLIVTSVWNPYDAFAAAAYAGKTNSAFLLEDTQDLDSVSHALEYVGKQEGAVKHLTFLGDGMRFAKLDKKILGKAVIEALGEDAPELDEDEEEYGAEESTSKSKSKSKHAARAETAAQQPKA